MFFFRVTSLQDVCDTNCDGFVPITFPWQIMVPKGRIS